MKNVFTLYFLLLVLLISCGQKTAEVSAAPQQEKREIPVFNADSALYFVQRQVDFGPRVPNTESHRQTADFLALELQRFGANVTVQKADLTAFDGTVLHARNIIGSFNPEAKNRILLMAHWDSRPFSDQDPKPDNYRKPVTGANDGASGVGVLLEIARIIGQNASFVQGIDIIFFDAEDYGIPVWDDNFMEDSWCLGSQYWAQNPHTENYTAKLGILLDMVGGANAVFLQEQISMQYASAIVEKVWNTAQKAGFGHLFKSQHGGAITDDHLYVNRLAHIPSIDIIDFDPSRPNGFPNAWHTTYDTMRNIDRETLRAVGETLLMVIDGLSPHLKTIK